MHTWMNSSGRKNENGNLFKALQVTFFRENSIGVWIQDFALWGRCSTAWAMPSALFTLVILEIGFCFLSRLPRPWTIYFKFFMVTEMTDLWHHTQLFSIKMETYCQGCPRTTILLISASQVAGIMGMSHWHPASPGDLMWNQDHESLQWLISELSQKVWTLLRTGYSTCRVKDAFFLIGILAAQYYIPGCDALNTSLYYCQILKLSLFQCI
jgi:hypothetical protein